MKFKLDFFAFEVVAGFDILRRYISLMEEQLGKAEADDNKRIADAELDFDDWTLEYQLHSMHFERNFPRNLRYSFVIFVFSVFETSLKASCDQISERGKLALRLSNLRANSAVSLARLFLEKVGNVGGDFPWDSIGFLNNVRDCIVHASGEISKSNVARELERQSGKIPGYSIDGGLIWLEKDFCEWAVIESKKFFEELLKPPPFGPLTNERVVD